MLKIFFLPQLSFVAALQWLGRHTHQQVSTRALPIETGACSVSSFLLQIDRLSRSDSEPPFYLLPDMPAPLEQSQKSAP